MAFTTFSEAALAAGPERMARELVAAQPALAQHPDIAGILGADMAQFQAEAPMRARDRFLDAVTRRGQGRKTSTRTNYGISPSTAAVNAIIDRQDPGNVEKRAADAMRENISGAIGVGPSGRIGYEAAQARRAANRNRANAFRAANAEAQMAFNRDAFMSDMARRNPRAFAAMMQAQLGQDRNALAREQMGAENRYRDARLALQGRTEDRLTETAAAEAAFRQARADIADRQADRTYNLQSQEATNAAEGRLASLRQQERVAEMQHAARMAAAKNDTERNAETARHNENMFKLKARELHAAGADISGLEGTGDAFTGVPKPSVTELATQAKLDQVLRDSNEYLSDLAAVNSLTEGLSELEEQGLMTEALRKRVKDKMPDRFKQFKNRERWGSGGLLGQYSPMAWFDNWMEGDEMRALDRWVE